MIGVGTLLAGRYRLEQHIAGGGMGDVWRSFDHVLDRVVAVKILRAPTDEPTFVDRFRTEARTMATVSHPGVVEVYDFGEDPTAGVYLVMKYVGGESLAHTLARRGRLNTEETMRLVAEAAEALHAAHEKGVIHRDVKPGNLLRRSDGGIVLTDFGVARSTQAPQRTSTGTLLGTAGYIAPERATGQPATVQSDIYSLGVVAYRCLSGRLPFVADSAVELALRHAQDEPPPLPDDVPAAVRAIVARAMAKNPAARWPSGAVLAAAARQAMGLGSATARPTVALESARRHPTVPTQRRTLPPTRPEPAAGPRHGRRLLGAAVAVLAVAAVATTAVILGRGRDPDASSTDPGVLGTAPDGPLATVGGADPSAPGSILASATIDASPSTPATPSAGAATPVGRSTGPLAAPTNLVATAISPDTVRLRWTDNSTNEDGFTIHNGVVARNVGANVTSYEWTGFAAATHTCFKVRAFNTTGVSDYFPAAETDWVCVTTLQGVGPARPTDLVAFPINPTTIRLEWTDNSVDEDGFTIYNGITTRNVRANATSYEWDNLAPNTYMCFKIRSYRQTGVSGYYPNDPDWVCTQTPRPDDA